MIEPEDGRGAEEEQVHVVDRRRFSDPSDLPAPDADVPRRPPPAYVQELEERLGASELRVEETLSAYRRQQEEMREVRRRLDRDLEVRLDEAKIQIFHPLLEVLDHMDLAVQAAESSGREDPLVTGLDLIRRELLTALLDSGVERLEPLGETFDPETAEARTVVAVEEAEQHDRVVEVQRAGYRLGVKLLRPALVVVGRCGDKAAEGS